MNNLEYGNIAILLLVMSNKGLVIYLFNVKTSIKFFFHFSIFCPRAKLFKKNIYNGTIFTSLTMRNRMPWLTTVRTSISNRVTMPILPLLSILLTKAKPLPSNK